MWLHCQGYQTAKDSLPLGIGVSGLSRLPKHERGQSEQYKFIVSTSDSYEPVVYFKHINLIIKMVPKFEYFYIINRKFITVQEPIRKMSYR